MPFSPTSPQTLSLIQRCRQEGLSLRRLPASTRDEALRAIAEALRQEAAVIEQANREDLEAARQAGLAQPLLKRLEYGPKKIEESARGLEALAALPDPLGRVLEARELDQGLRLYRVTVPIGVVALIFESRPDALVQMAGLCWKSGNGVVLKGGSEALRTNQALAGLIQKTLQSLGLSEGWLALLETREHVREILSLEDLIDLVIPRGSNAFVRSIMDQTRIPVLGHADGIVHLYLHEDAPLELALPLTVDSKTQYPAVCNALETLLVHRKAAPHLLPPLAQALRERGVRLRGCDQSRALVADMEVATEEDWSTEYLDLVLAIRVVDDLTAAIDHINRYGSHHTDGIVTRDPEVAREFFDLVDSADVFWNASTRFSDGYRYGLGAEVGIATGKLHARGPMGLDGLVTYQWRLFGDGHLVVDYAEGRRRFRHQDLPLDSYPYRS